MLVQYVGAICWCRVDNQIQVRIDNRLYAVIKRTVNRFFTLICHYICVTLSINITVEGSLHYNQLQQSLDTSYIEDAHYREIYIQSFLSVLPNCITLSMEYLICIFSRK